MRRIVRSSALIAVTAIFLTGCVFAPVMPPRGILYNNQTAPLTPMGAKGEKEGRASSHNVLFLVGWGNSGLEQAMDNGDINRMTNADYQVLNIALLYQRYTTIARGN